MHPAFEGLASLPYYDEFDLSTVDLLLISQYVTLSLSVCFDRTQYVGMLGFFESGYWDTQKKSAAAQLRTTQLDWDVGRGLHVLTEKKCNHLYTTVLNMSMR